MNCLSFICQNDDDEQQLKPDQTKKIYVQSQKRMGLSYANPNCSKFRDQRKSLRRSVTPTNDYVLRFGQPNLYQLATNKITSSFNRPVSNRIQQVQKIIEPANRYSQPQLPNHNRQASQLTQQPPQPIPPSFPQQNRRIVRNQPIYINQPNQIVPNKNINFSYQSSQLYPTKQIKNQNNLSRPVLNQTQIVRQYPICSTMINFINVVPEKSSLQTKRVQEIRQVDQKIQMKKDNLLKPIEQVQPAGSRISRSATNIYHIDDIACTKTQSVGSSSKSSSEFSQIIYSINDQNQNKLTNSSINFVNQDQQIKADPFENVKGSPKVKKIQTMKLGKRGY